jgi:hypothetical protein
MNLTTLARRIARLHRASASIGWFLCAGALLLSG